MAPQHSHPRSALAGRVLALAIAACLAGCAHKPQTLYDWQGYPEQVHEYLSADKSTLDAQAKAMEDGLARIRAEGGAVPPGYHAHLALLYARQGRLDAFAGGLEAEKARFPESQTFVDFLLRHFKPEHPGGARP